MLKLVWSFRVIFKKEKRRQKKILGGGEDYHTLDLSHTGHPIRNSLATCGCQGKCIFVLFEMYLLQFVTVIRHNLYLRGGHSVSGLRHAFHSFITSPRVVGMFMQVSHCFPRPLPCNPNNLLATNCQVFSAAPCTTLWPILSRDCPQNSSNLLPGVLRLPNHLPVSRPVELEAYVVDFTSKDSNHLLIGLPVVGRGVPNQSLCLCNYRVTQNYKKKISTLITYKI